MAQSIMDYIFRRLALDYMTFDERSMLGIYTAEERQRHLETGSYEPLELSEAESLKTEHVDAAKAEAAPVEAEIVSEAPAAAEPAGRAAKTSAELLEIITGTAVDSPLCFTCGTKMRPAGSCYVCEGCGSTSGCS
jgi:ribonucleoside-diphosphate reductase alpha chain